MDYEILQINWNARTQYGERCGNATLEYIRKEVKEGEHFKHFKRRSLLTFQMKNIKALIDYTEIPVVVRTPRALSRRRRPKNTRGVRNSDYA